MNPKIKPIVEQAVVDIARKMEISPMLASLELLQCVIQTIPTSGDSLLDYCREVIKEKCKQEAA